MFYLKKSLDNISHLNVLTTIEPWDNAKFKKFSHIIFFHIQILHKQFEVVTSMAITVAPTYKNAIYLDPMKSMWYINEYKGYRWSQDQTNPFFNKVSNPFFNKVSIYKDSLSSQKNFQLISAHSYCTATIQNKIGGVKLTLLSLKIMEELIL